MTISAPHRRRGSPFLEATLRCTDLKGNIDDLKLNSTLRTIVCVGSQAGFPKLGGTRRRLLDAPVSV